METRIRLQIEMRGPLAGGLEFGSTGAYERISGKVHFEIDAAEPANATIVDLGNAPRNDEGFVELLVADAVLSGGKGINLWAGGFGRNARTTSPLYQALVEPELVAGVSSALMPTEQPYLYGISATVREGVAEAAIEEALFSALDAAAETKPSDHALRKAKNQLLAELAYDDEGVTRIAHQLGFFTTIGARDRFGTIPGEIEAITAEQVRDVVARRLSASNRTVGWFRPRPPA